MKQVSCELDDERSRGILESCYRNKAIPDMLVVTTYRGDYMVSNLASFQDQNEMQRLYMSSWSDILHEEVGLININATLYDQNSLADTTWAEKDACLQKMGLEVYASGLHATNVDTT